MKNILRSGAMAAAVGVGLAVTVLPAVPAAADSGNGVRCNDIAGLKAAINQANASGGRIILASHCTYNLTAPDNLDDGLPEITGNVTISGKDTTIRRAPTATQDFRIFHVVSGGTLTLNSLTVSNGRLAADNARGGGIFNANGTLNLNRTVIKNNFADGGGGIGTLSGRTNLDRSTVERNTASFGGGINKNGGGTLTMRGGSLLNNRAPNGSGGGLANLVGSASLESVSVRGNSALVGGGIHNTSGLRLTSVTVRDNIAVSGAGISNDSVAGLGSSLTLVRSLVTRNTAITAGGGILNEATLGEVTLTDSRVVRNRPDNCSPAGSVPGCTNPASAVTPPASQLPPPAGDSKVRK